MDKIFLSFFLVWCSSNDRKYNGREKDSSVTQQNSFSMSTTKLLLCNRKSVSPDTWPKAQFLLVSQFSSQCKGKEIRTLLHLKKFCQIDGIQIFVLVWTKVITAILSNLIQLLFSHQTFFWYERAFYMTTQFLLMNANDKMLFLCVLHWSIFQLVCC